MAHRFLHLSDIHFGQENDGSLVTHDHIREALVRDAAALARSRGTATRVLVTGDTAYSGTTEEYETAIQWLEKLTRACGCDVTHVSTIPGNHDCDRRGISHQAQMIYATLRNTGPGSVDTILHRITADGEAANPFLPKLGAYRKFASGFGCDFESPARPMWMRDFDLRESVKLRFFGLTSVQVSDKNDAVGNMVLGNQQYTISEEADTVNIVLLHHPLDWFIDEAAASHYLHNNVRVIMVGHEHSLTIHKTEDPTTRKEWLVIYAGAVTPPGGVLGYRYNWLEFTYEEDAGKNYVGVEIFPRVWVQQRVRFEADYERLGTGSSESLKVRIHCPNVNPQPISCFEASASSTDPAEQENPSIPLDASPGQPSAIYEEQRTMGHQTAGFDQLRYLFWRYLDWQQRLKALIAVDALPETADQPLPQVLERVALETAAKDTNKLQELWDVIMPLIPVDKRGPNPFSKG